MKHIYTAFFFASSLVAITACGGNGDNKEESTIQADSTPDSTANTATEPTNTNTNSGVGSGQTTTPPAAKPIDYTGFMAEYHLLLCESAKARSEGQPVNVDRTLRLAEVKRQLDKVAESLSGEEKTKFNFALARANNLQSCP